MTKDMQSRDSPIVRERCLDIAYRWLTVCSDVSCYTSTEALANFTDEELADRCIAKWGLDLPQADDNDLTFFEAHNADRRNLIDAFAAVRVVFTMSTNGM
jgi:hypothetical protein